MMSRSSRPTPVPMLTTDTYKERTKILNEENKAARVGLSLAGTAQRDMKAVEKADKTKFNKYFLFEQLLQLQHAAGAIPRGAVFIPLVATHQGILGHKFRDVIEDATGRFKRFSCRKVILDGLQTWQRVAEFRRSFKDSIMKQIAIGGARMLRASWFGAHVL